MAVSLQGNHLSIASPVFLAFGCSTMVSLISFLRRITWRTLTSARDLDGNISQIRRGASEIEKIETNYIRIPSLGMMVCNCVTILEIKQIETTIKYNSSTIIPYLWESIDYGLSGLSSTISPTIVASDMALFVPAVH